MTTSRRSSDLVYLIESELPITGLAITPDGTLAILSKGQGLGVELPPIELLKFAETVRQVAAGLAEKPENGRYRVFGGMVGHG